MNRDSSVGIATRYGMDGVGIESRWRGEIFHTRPVRPWPPPPVFCTIGTGSFPGIKRSGRGDDKLPNLSPGLKKQYSYTLLPLWGLFASSRVKFTFYNRKEILFDYKIWALKTR
jgi:hypothetical protein